MPSPHSHNRDNKIIGDRRENGNKRVQRLASLSICLALTLTLSYVEYLVIPPIFPGVKLGISNVLIMFIFFRYGVWDAVCVSLMRVGISSLLLGNLSSFAFSLCGAVLSVLALVICSLARDRVSRIGTSVLSAAMHGIGQIIAAAIIYSSVGVVYYLPFLLLLSLPVGAVSGCMLILIEERISPNVMTK